LKEPIRVRVWVWVWVRVRVRVRLIDVEGLVLALEGAKVP